MTLMTKRSVESVTFNDKGIGLTYFVAAPNEELLKNGHSKDVEEFKRVIKHLSVSPFGYAGGEGNAVLLAVCRATRNDHDKIMDHFADTQSYAVKGQREIFNAVERWINYIAFLREQVDFVATSLEDFIHVRNNIRPFRMWTPSDPNHISRRRYERDSLFEPQGPWSKVFASLNETADDYYTPMHYIEMVREFYGGKIPLDVASHPAANVQIRADEFFTIADDGLTRDWLNSDGEATDVWLSPPHDPWGRWAQQAIIQLDQGKVRQLIAIVCARQSASSLDGHMWEFRRRANAYCLIDGRDKKWWGAKVNADSASNSAYQLFYFGKDVERFCCHFESLGPTSLRFR